ncbi:Protein of unknown function [Catalinimonas alkaloidigena]|uniref:DUF2723 domain-containing protein n=1 Tax=Catalinimonas alkaloidigena TaxID=1075417 RepID=A0A1G9A692_9BACT|nr:DUF2723 domain-containing protein [Catalinimonas alkaloidigena]SDK22856.1 Protein of unknown function [Catalinimonas alkaloidigena]
MNLSTFVTRHLVALSGWGVLLLSTGVYLLSLEPTASFWDCGEFIACAYKLQVPHPPGAPFFLLLGRMFSLLALGDVTRVAFWVNVLSAMASGLTVFFLYESIVLLARKLLATQPEGRAKDLLLIGSGVVGSLAFAFTDSFWFSAVEAEVYALSSCFTAFVFWAMLRWETKADQPGADRWLLLIAYAIGLSLGVHLLNLLAIPALAFVYYFKKFTPTRMGVLLTLGAACLILVAVLSGIMTGLPSLAAQVELFFVNSLRLPFYSGVLVVALVVLVGLVWGLVWAQRHRKIWVHTTLLAVVFILIGYGSYGITLIRAHYHPPINMSAPDDLLPFISYLKREQYGERPLLKGPDFNAPLLRQERGAPVYAKRKERYEIQDYRTELVWDPSHMRWFPRLASTESRHASAYRQFFGIPTGQDLSQRRFRTGDNLQFFFRYQLGHMYGRYFLWNFAGRAGGEQHAASLWPWEWGLDLPETLAHDRARNQYFALPLLLGLLGLWFHFRRRAHDAWVVTLLFFFTGVAVIVYLNQPPVEPRERDYAFAGSFYAFAIWIGLGVIALAQLIQRWLPRATLRAGVAGAVGLLVPLVLLAENWDDHNRAGRYYSVDSARNLLNSCAPHAILFTGGDNDTYPLWYVQSVEGFRTDVRVCHLSLLDVDWYANQMKERAYQSAPLPISFTPDQFQRGTNDYLPYVAHPQAKNGVDLEQYLKLVKEEHPAIQVGLQGGGTANVLPTKTLRLAVNRDEVVSSGTLPASADIAPQLEIQLTQNHLTKADLLVLDMIATNHWQRPIYFSASMARENYLNLWDYLQLEGGAYRLVPGTASPRIALDPVPGASSEGHVAADIMYDRMMHHFFWRNLDDATRNYDSEYRRNALIQRGNFQRLATQLLQEGKTEQAREAMVRCLEVMPDAALPYDFYSVQLVAPLLNVGEGERATHIATTMSRRAEEELAYQERHPDTDAINPQLPLYILQQLALAYQQHGDATQAERYRQLLERYASLARR